jgi:Flagellar biosynthesis protein, FliO
MQAVVVQERVQEIREGPASSPRARGLGRGLVWSLLERLGVCRARSEAQLELLETLSLGGRRQLFLIACGGERYLVGVGAEGVGSMLRVGPVGAADKSGSGERA